MHIRVGFIFGFFSGVWDNCCWGNVGGWWVHHWTSSIWRWEGDGSVQQSSKRGRKTRRPSRGEVRILPIWLPLCLFAVLFVNLYSSVVAFISEVGTVIIEKLNLSLSAPSCRFNSFYFHGSMCWGICCKGGQIYWESRKLGNLQSLSIGIIVSSVYLILCGCGLLISLLKYRGWRVYLQDEHGTSEEALSLMIDM